MKKIEGMKCSEVLRIEAAVMEKAEEVYSDVVKDTGLMPGMEEGELLMTVLFKEPTVDNLNKFGRLLGTDFTLKLLGKGKSGVFIVISAKQEAFRKLVQPIAAAQSVTREAQSTTRSY